MILQENFTLSNGVRIPKLGYGTWMIPDAEAAHAVSDAIAIGYRHIDTAQAYANERGVGDGVRNSGVPRDQIFVTTKLAAESKSYLDAKQLIDGSLQALALDHIDLMLIHSPQPWSEFRAGDRYFEGNADAWRALEEAHQAGKLRAVGVSNFEREDIENLLANGRLAPMVNQVLAHVGNTPFDLIEYCRSKDILVQAYSPVAHGAVLKDAGLQDMAERYGVSVAQLCIRYCLQLNLLPLPKTLNPVHMRDNAAVDFTISDEDMNALRGTGAGTDYGEAGKFPVFGKKRQPEPTPYAG
ncbi:aldo/keto reductase [Parablastomonas sp. CN1-191]|uniref:aldo/keto reductase n=1 Tax=Parablastomonas sp. CN1-191 TaxID=3400908 RepID=UPI003BF79EB3